MSEEKRHPDEKPWQPHLDKQGTFNPFANDQNPANDPELDLDELEEGDSNDKIKPGDQS